MVVVVVLERVVMNGGDVGEEMNGGDGEGNVSRSGKDGKKVHIVWRLLVFGSDGAL